MLFRSDELPHKRALVGRELARRSQFLHLLRTRPEGAPLAKTLTALFSLSLGGLTGVAK